MSTTNKISSCIIVLIFGFTCGVLYGSGYFRTLTNFNLIYPGVRRSSQNPPTIYRQYVIQSFPEGYNSTHLWSMRVADENYFRLANILPCRNVSYVHGPIPGVMDSCDRSPEYEFSLPSLISAQKWIYEHQNPQDCSNKRFAIIQNYAPSGFGSTVHQVAWAFGKALGDGRIAVYQTPGNWLYGTCDSRTPDCFFLPISNCSVPSTVDGNQTIRIRADIGHWAKPVFPPVFQNRTYNWVRTQLIFYLMRFRPEVLAHAQNTVIQNFDPPSVDLHHPYIAVYVRRSDKVSHKEMSQAYSLQQYFDLFDADARRANISNVYINSEDVKVFDEFEKLNKEKQGYYKLLSVEASRNVVYASLTRMSKEQRRKIVLEFLTDLFIEANADLHVGTLTSNWCRLVDEIRLVLGKTIPYYTPEKEHRMDG